ncbi:plasmid mobilization relaxosome protein MobC [Streptomyces carpaticus]|uniref:plasmid mobilization relaxosome protein MobC n=1 Tax=Streptomyces carpaticus TaxID=285558 RepID=UPI0031F8E5E9
MTHPAKNTPNTITSDTEPTTVRARASYPFGSSPAPGEASKGDATPAGEAKGPRLQGEPSARAATEGGPQHRDTNVPSLDDVLELVKQLPKPRRRLRHTQQRPNVRGVRLSDEELAMVEVAAAENGLPVAAFLSIAAVAAAGTRSSAAYVADDHARTEELFAARRHLRQVGNNLNQVAKAMNSGATAPQMETVLHAVDQAVRRIDAAVERLHGR